MIKSIKEICTKAINKVMYNDKAVKTIYSLALMTFLVIGFETRVFAASGEDPFTSIMTIVCGLLKKIGGVVCFVGAFRIIWGFKDHNPDTKMQGIEIAAVGGGLFTLASAGGSFLN